MNRDKMKHLILFFLEKEGGDAYITKLLKLLYFADFHAYANNMESITGAKYEAWENGPVCRPVWEAFKHNNSFEGIESYVGEGRNSVLSGNLRFNSKPFTPGDLDSMEKVWDSYGAHNGNELIEKSHEDLPWRASKRTGKTVIPYGYANYAYMEGEGDDEPDFSEETQERWDRMGEEAQKIAKKKGIRLGA